MLERKIENEKSKIVSREKAIESEDKLFDEVISRLNKDYEMNLKML